MKHESRFQRFLTESQVESLRRERSLSNDLGEWLDISMELSGPVLQFASVLGEQSKNRPTDMELMSIAASASREVIRHGLDMMRFMREYTDVSAKITLNELMDIVRRFCFWMNGTDSFTREEARDALISCISTQFSLPDDRVDRGGTDVTPQVKAMDATIPMVA